MTKLMLAVPLILLASCGGGYFERQEQAKQDEVLRLGAEANQSPNTSSYKEGANHGCASGHNATGDFTSKFTKNIDKYVTDPYYKSGWDDGFQQCKAQGELAQDIIDGSLR